MLNLVALNRKEAQKLYRLIESAQESLKDALVLANSLIPVDLPPPGVPRKKRSDAGNPRGNADQNPLCQYT